jgi:hypothetical protein
MAFLVAKMFFLLALAAGCGALFTYGWFRRHYQDVTQEYAQWRSEWARWRAGFEERLAARPAVDLQPLLRQLAALDGAVRGIEMPDLSPVDKRLTAIEHALFPVQTRLDELESAVRALHPAPAPTPTPTLDLSPVPESLGALQSRLENPPPAEIAAHEGGVGH